MTITEFTSIANKLKAVVSLIPKPELPEIYTKTVQRWNDRNISYPLGPLIDFYYANEVEKDLRAYLHNADKIYGDAGEGLLYIITITNTNLRKTKAYRKLFNAILASCAKQGTLPALQRIKTRPSYQPI